MKFSRIPSAKMKKNLQGAAEANLNNLNLHERLQQAESKQTGQPEAKIASNMSNFGINIP